MNAENLVVEAITDPTGIPVMDINLSRAEICEHLLRILEDSCLCSLATLTPNHQAYANTAYFGYSADLDIYFCSHPNAQHCQNLQANPSMAIAVYSSVQTWGGLDRGLQLFGQARLAEGDCASQASQIYQARFPAFADWQKALGPDDPGRSYRFYHFRTERVKIFDEKSWERAPFVVARIRRYAKD